MKIERNGNNYRITFKPWLNRRAVSVRANNLSEVKRAIDHVFSERSLHVFAGVSGCPICAWQQNRK